MGDPLDKAVDMGAIIAPVQLKKIEELVRRGQEEGASLWQPSWSCPAGRLVLPADPLHRGGACGDDRAGGDLRPGGGADDLPDAGGSGGAGQQHALRTRGERLDREHQPRAGRRAPAQGRDGVDQLHQRVRRGQRVRRLPRERVRAGGGAGGAAGVREVGERRRASGRTGGRTEGRKDGKTEVGQAGERRRDRAGAKRQREGVVRADTDRSSGRSADPPGHGHSTDRPDAEALHRRQAGPARFGLQPGGARCGAGGGSARWGTGTGRTCGTRSRRRARPRGGRAPRRTRGRRCCTTSRRTWPRGRRSSGTESPRSRRRSRRRRARGRALDRADLHLRRLGGQVRRSGPPHALPERHAGDARAARRARRRLPRGTAAARLPVDRAAGDRHGEHGRRGAVRPAARWSPPTCTRCSTRPTCRAAC